MISSIIKVMRPHQWVKNLLLFVPLLMAHSWGDGTRLKPVLLGFIAFSFCASGVYCINDLVDLEADRQHPYKKNRPFASAALPTQTGYFLAPILFLVSYSIGYSLGESFLLVLTAYLVLTTAYSFALKRIVIVDIIALATLYSIRIFAGGITARTPVSHWLLVFSMFIFFSLACVKRYSELYVVRRDDKKKAHGRGYFVEDLESIHQLGVTSGISSVLVMALYVSSLEVKGLYSNPFLLWVVCPALFYWISRVWLKTFRGEMHDDPIVFALRDSTSYFVGAICFIAIFFAI